MAFVYVVTRYGCNSGVNCMWIPNSRVFADQQSAILYYNKCEKEIGDENVDYLKEKTFWNSCQDSYEHKRPKGVVLRIVKLEGVDEKENEKTDKDENNAE